ncbi:MAG: peptidylprolyl isomerase, partial [Arenibacter sp.]|nr:peptidylprolyl isomerase [Arenibacter sp.]
MYKLLLPLLFVLSTCASNKTFEIGQIKTPKGEILVWLYDETPNHKQSFIQLAKAGYWDSLTFNRVIPNFVAQGGCPDTPEGFNDPE